MAMVDCTSRAPSKGASQPTPPPPPPTLPALPVPSPPPPPAPAEPPSRRTPAAPFGLPFPFPRPALRVTSEYDSDSQVFFHRVSCGLFDRLAKLKLCLLHNRNGEVSSPQLRLNVGKRLSVDYDVEAQNAVIKGSFDVGDKLQFHATRDWKTGQVGEPNCFHIGCSTKSFSVSCSCDSKCAVSSIDLESVVFKFHHKKEQQGEVTMITKVAEPSYKIALTSAIPTVGLPRAAFQFPAGEVSIEEKEDENDERVLSMNGILKGQVLNGICTVQYEHTNLKTRSSDRNLRLRYLYKDEEMAFIPEISLPSNAASLTFKRQFSPSDKLSYCYHFHSNDWNTVYKHTYGDDLKLKVGYDSEVRLGWASLWVGEEEGKTKTAPMKMKVQFMLQVPQDDIAKSVLLFRVKKRWDF